MVLRYSQIVETVIHTFQIISLSLLEKEDKWVKHMGESNELELFFQLEQ